RGQVAVLHRSPRGHLLSRRAAPHRRPHGRRGEPLRGRPDRGHPVCGTAPGGGGQPRGQLAAHLPAQRREELRHQASHRGHLRGGRSRGADRRHHHRRREQVRSHRGAGGSRPHGQGPRHPHRPRAGRPGAPRLQGLYPALHPDHHAVPGRVGDGGPRERHGHPAVPRVRAGDAVRMMRAVHDGVGELLMDEAAIQAEVARLGAQISADYAGKSLHVIGVLKGAAVFLADLMRAVTIPATLDFISIVPYGQVTASGVVRIRKDLDEPLEGKDVLVVEGVCASGLSLSYLLRNFQTRKPASPTVGQSVVRQGPAVASDLYAFGGGVDVQADVEGDLVAGGGRVVNGKRVQGNLIVAAGSVEIGGAVMRNVRAAGGAVTISGRVARNVNAGGGTVVVTPDGVIEGRARLVGGEVRMAGTVAKKLYAAGAVVVIGGEVQGDVELVAQEIEVLPSARIKGHLTYWSPRDARISPKAQIEGSITHNLPELPRALARTGAALFTVSRLLFVIGLIVTAIALFLLFPGFTRLAAQTIGSDPLKSLGLGVLLCVTVP